MCSLLMPCVCVGLGSRRLTLPVDVYNTKPDKKQKCPQIERGCFCTIFSTNDIRSSYASVNASLLFLLEVLYCLCSYLLFYFVVVCMTALLGSRALTLPLDGRLFVHYCRRVRVAVLLTISLDVCVLFSLMLSCPRDGVGLVEQANATPGDRRGRGWELQGRI